MGWRFHHGAVSVPDIEAAADWYGRVLGFERESSFTIPGDIKAMFLRRGPMRIELFEHPDPAPLPAERADPRADLATLGNKHFCFEVDQYDEARTELEAKGVEIILEVGDSFGRGFFFRDLVGNVLEVVETR